MDGEDGPPKMTGNDDDTTASTTPERLLFHIDDSTEEDDQQLPAWSCVLMYGGDAPRGAHHYHHGPWPSHDDALVRNMSTTKVMYGIT